MEELVFLRLRCHKLELVEVHELSHPKSADQIVLLKGYALRFKKQVHELPATLIDLLLSHIYLAWDGDDYADDSFTKIIPYCVMKCIQRGKVPRLIALKHIDSESDFLSSWHDKAFSFTKDCQIQSPTVLTTHLLPINVVIHDVNIQYSLVSFPSDLKALDVTFYPPPFPLSLDYSTNNNSNNNVPYFENEELFLALECLRLTRAETIVCFGGGLYIQSEYMKMMDIFKYMAITNNDKNIDNTESGSNDNSSSSVSSSSSTCQQLTWHIYLMTRETSSDKSIEENTTSLTSETAPTTIQSINSIDAKSPKSESYVKTTADLMLSPTLESSNVYMPRNEEKCFWERLPLDLQHPYVAIPNFHVVIYR